MNKYVRPNSAIRERIAKEYSMFGTDKILGVAVRAEMYWGSITGNKGVKGHSKVPGVEELIRIVEKKLEEWNYDSIFFMTEDRSYHDIMSDHFGSRFHSVTRPLLNYFIDGQPVMDLKVIKREFENYSIQSKIEDYITEVYLLSMCDSVYATVEGGTVCAGIINGGKYLHAEYYDRGDIT